MKLLDANVPSYAVGDESPFKVACMRILQHHAETAEPLYTVDVELLQEILHFYRARKQIEKALAVFDNLMRAFPEPLPILREELTLARDLLERYPTLQARDALHCAVVLTNQLEGIVSVDRGFDLVREVTRFDPVTLAQGLP